MQWIEIRSNVPLEYSVNVSYVALDVRTLKASAIYEEHVCTNQRSFSFIRLGNI